MFKANIGVLGLDADIRKVCEDIKKRDKTFNYELKPARGKLGVKFNCVLVIYDETEEGVNKRSGWFIHKMKDAKVANYYWVRECKQIKK